MKVRNVGLCIILTLITCGWYGLYWYIVMTNDAREAANDTSLPNGGICMLLTIVTCGLYSFYWVYKMGELVKKAQQDRNMSVSDNSILYIVLMLLGLGIVDYCIIQSNLNTIASQNKTVGA